MPRSGSVTKTASGEKLHVAMRLSSIPIKLRKDFEVRVYRNIPIRVYNPLTPNGPRFCTVVVPDQEYKHEVFRSSYDKAKEYVDSIMPPVVYKYKVMKETLPVECPWCDGTGATKSGRLCGKCKGEGRHPIY